MREELKLKFSRKGYKHTEATKEKQRVAATGRKHTPESIEKIRKTHSGSNHYKKKLTQEHSNVSS